MESQNSIIDLSFLRKFTSGDEDKMKYYIELYFETVPRLFDDIYAAIARMDYIELYTKTHSLKPLTSYVGIIGLSATLSDLEKAAIENRSEDYLTLLANKAFDMNTKGMTELTAYLNAKG